MHTNTLCELQFYITTPNTVLKFTSITPTFDGSITSRIVDSGQEQEWTYGSIYTLKMYVWAVNLTNLLPKLTL